jgi:hypothetical protein
MAQSISAPVPEFASYQACLLYDARRDRVTQRRRSASPFGHLIRREAGTPEAVHSIERGVFDRCLGLLDQFSGFRQTPRRLQAWVIGTPVFVTTILR